MNFNYFSYGKNKFEKRNIDIKKQKFGAINVILIRFSLLWYYCYCTEWILHIWLIKNKLCKYIIVFKTWIRIVIKIC